MLDQTLYDYETITFHPSPGGKPRAGRLLYRPPHRTQTSVIGIGQRSALVEPDPIQRIYPVGKEIDRRRTDRHGDARGEKDSLCHRSLHVRQRHGFGSQELRLGVQPGAGRASQRLLHARRQDRGLRRADENRVIRRRAGGSAGTRSGARRGQAQQRAHEPAGHGAIRGQHPRLHRKRQERRRAENSGHGIRPRRPIRHDAPLLAQARIGSRLYGAGLHDHGRL